MRIVVIGGYAPAVIGFRGPLMKSLAAAGYDVTVLADPASDELRQRILDLGVQFRSVDVQRNQIGVRADLKFFSQLRAQLQELKPDVVFTYMHKPIIYGSLAAAISGIPCRKVAMITGLGYPFEANTPKHLAVRTVMWGMYRAALAQCDSVIFHNEDDRDVMLRYRMLSRNQTAVVNGSGVDLTHYIPADVPPLDANTPIRFLMISRLVRSKGVVDYVDAIRLLRKKYPQAIFDLVGPADPHPQGLTEDCARAWEKEGLIRYHGAVSDVRPFLEQCHVYVLPSWAEGMPRSVLEAMATGRAVITTDARGCRSTVASGVNGLLVAVKNPKSLSDAMEQLIAHPDWIVSMAEKGRERVKAWDVNRVNAQMQQLIIGQVD